MLLLGHASWGYITGRIAGAKLGIQPNLYLLLIVAMLPDVDLILGILGVQHRTATHSVFFWSLLFVPVFYRYRIRAVPYYVALIQHIVFGDLVVGRTSIFWPLTDPKLGLALPIISPVNLVLEAIGFALFCLMAIRNGDFASLRVGPLTVIAVLPFASFVALASFGDSLLPILVEGSDAKHLERNLASFLASPSFQVVLMLHLAMIVVLVGFSLRASMKRRLNARRV